MIILRKSICPRVIPVLFILLSLVALRPETEAAPVAAAESRDREGAEAGYKPSAQTRPGTAISDPARLRAVAEAPAALRVGLDEHLGVRIPLELSFRDEDGQPVVLRALVTRPTVIAPVYYRCPNVCHFLQGELARVLPELKLVAGSDYQVLSVSFDADETPELARRTRDTYLAAAGGKVPAAGWRFLTGDPASITALTDAAGFHFQWLDGEFQHPVALIVVAADGTIIRYLHGTRILPKDLALALYEAKQGHVGTTIRKMVQYCFSYDPERKTYVFNVLRVSATVILVTLGAFLVFLLLTGRKHSKDRTL